MHPYGLIEIHFKVNKRKICGSNLRPYVLQCLTNKVKYYERGGNRSG